MKEFNKRHLFWIIPLILISLSLFVPSDTNKLNDQIDNLNNQIDNLNNQIDNLETGLKEYCELSKMSGTTSLATMDLLKALGYPQPQENRMIFERMENQNCIQVVNEWKNK